VLNTSPDGTRNISPLFAIVQMRRDFFLVSLQEILQRLMKTVSLENKRR
jgi:hypothetical protein